MPKMEIISVHQMRGRRSGMRVSGVVMRIGMMRRIHVVMRIDVVRVDLVRVVMSRILRMSVLGNYTRRYCQLLWMSNFRRRLLVV